MMKKLILCLMLAAGLIIGAGCGNGSAGSAKDAEFLTSADYWWHYNEVTGESEKMSFGVDLSFYWGCECGEPIGDSDLLELYDYDSETKTIRLYSGYDDTEMEIEVLDYSDYHLLLEIDGEVRDYVCEDMMASEIIPAECGEYLAGYSMCSWIMKCDGEKAVIGPFNYDGDVEYPDNAFKEYKVADDIVFWDLQIRTVVNVDTGEEKTDVSYIELDREDGLAAMESGFGFIWFNEAMEIDRVTLYGAVYIQE